MITTMDGQKAHHDEYEAEDGIGFMITELVDVAGYHSMGDWDAAPERHLLELQAAARAVAEWAGDQLGRVNAKPRIGIVRDLIEEAVALYLDIGRSTAEGDQAILRDARGTLASYQLVEGKLLEAWHVGHD